MKGLDVHLWELELFLRTDRLGQVGTPWSGMSIAGTKVLTFHFFGGHYCLVFCKDLGFSSIYWMLNVLYSMQKQICYI